MDTTTTGRLETIDAIASAVVTVLAAPGYASRYDSEDDFEAAVWMRVCDFMPGIGYERQASCLTSHAERVGRSPDRWDGFLRDRPGPDVNIFESNTRLDIVLKCGALGSIGLEVKWLGSDRHAEKLIHGIGQAMLGLRNRDRTVLVVFCGDVDQSGRRELRQVLDRVTRGTGLSIVLVP